MMQKIECGAKTVLGLPKAEGDQPAELAEAFCKELLGLIEASLIYIVE